MDTWRIGEAKQRFSELIRRSGSEPQEIYNRSRLVAVVVSPDLLEEIRRLRPEQPTPTLAETFSELREICVEEGYELEIGERRDRDDWLQDDP